MHLLVVRQGASEGIARLSLRTATWRAGGCMAAILSHLQHHGLHTAQFSLAFLFLLPGTLLPSHSKSGQLITKLSVTQVKQSLTIITTGNNRSSLLMLD